MIRVSGDIDGSLDNLRGISIPDEVGLVLTAAAQALHSTALYGYGSQQYVITANASIPMIVRWPFDALSKEAKALLAQTRRRGLFLLLCLWTWAGIGVSSRGQGGGRKGFCVGRIPSHGSGNARDSLLGHRRAFLSCLRRSSTARS